MEHYDYFSDKTFKGREAYVYRFAIPIILSHFKVIDSYSYDNEKNIIHIKADGMELMFGSVNKIKGKNILRKEQKDKIKSIITELNNFKEENYE